jgi:hypothetical protein
VRKKSARRKCFTSSGYNLWVLLGLTDRRLQITRHHFVTKIYQYKQTNDGKGHAPVTVKTLSTSTVSRDSTILPVHSGSPYHHPTLRRFASSALFRFPPCFCKYEVRCLVRPELPIYLVHVYRSTCFLSARFQVKNGLLWRWKCWFFLSIFKYMSLIYSETCPYI